jgi:hypothetical protein
MVAMALSILAALAVSTPGFGVFVGLWGFFDRTNLMSIWYFDIDLVVKYERW